MKRIIIIAALAAAVLTPLTAFTDKTGFGSILWTYRLENKGNMGEFHGMSGPMYHNNRIYFTANWESYLYCLDAETGKKIWHFPFTVSAYQNFKDHGMTWTAGGHVINRVPIKLAAPLLISGDRIFFGASSFALFFGTVYCVNADTGKLVWRYPARSEVWQAPQSRHNGRIYLDIGCLEDATGRLLWAHNDLYRNGISADGNIVMSADNGSTMVYHTHGTNPPLWILSSANDKNPRRFDDITSVEAIFPSSHEGRIFISGTNENSMAAIFCVDLRTGKLAWKKPLGTGRIVIGKSHLVGDGRVICAVGSTAGEDGHYLVALDGRDGRSLWEVPVSLKYDVIFEPTYYQGNVYFTEHPHTLRCVSADTGKTLWTVQYMQPGRLDSVDYKAPAIHGNRAYVTLYMNSISSREIIKKEIICINIER
ncbi:MAG TPA: PQQ-binding-like beta-propeller repeat protein [Spirochaetota bacterium]|nr:PQQ-binding-like beta-propeller repeat protein [Spirochaetota bacterium]HPV41887.1 PQQ-binding-like beta-propeller repeat protein [Spirochaetota bacterium]